MLNSPTALPFQIVSTPVHSSSPQLACPRTEVSAQEKETIMLENLSRLVLFSKEKKLRVGSKERRADKRRKERGGGGRGEGGTQRSVLRNGSCKASRAVIDLFPKFVFLCIQDPNQGGVYGCLF